MLEFKNKLKFSDHIDNNFLQLALIRFGTTAIRVDADIQDLKDAGAGVWREPDDLRTLALKLLAEGRYGDCKACLAAIAGTLARVKLVDRYRDQVGRTASASSKLRGTTFSNSELHAFIDDYKKLHGRERGSKKAAADKFNCSVRTITNRLKT